MNNSKYLFSNLPFKINYLFSYYSAHCLRRCKAILLLSFYYFFKHIFIRDYFIFWCEVWQSWNNKAGLVHNGLLKSNFLNLSGIRFLCGNTGIWDQDLTLYHLSHCASQGSLSWLANRDVIISTVCPKMKWGTMFETPSTTVNTSLISNKSTSTLFSLAVWYSVAALPCSCL
jgi:hypothetical protein